MPIMVDDGVFLRCPKCGNEDGITVLEKWGTHVKLRCWKCGFEGSNDDLPPPPELKISILARLKRGIGR